MLTAARTLSAKSPAIPLVLNEPGLIPVSIQGKESLNSLYAYTVVLKTPDSLTHLGAEAANYDLEQFVGQALTVEIQLEGSGTYAAGAAGGQFGNIGAGTREISGIITSAKVQRQVGRYVYYDITLEPWLSLAGYNSDCRIFQNKTPLQILDEVLSRYGFAVEKRLFDRYDQALDYTTQYNESDFQFFSRMTERFGINYFFEHKDGSHTLILADANQAHRSNPSEAYKTLNYYAEQPRRIDQEYIQHFTPTQRLSAGSFSARDYDYTRPRSTWDVSDRDPDGAAPAEVYIYHHMHYVQPKAGAQQATNEPLIDGKYLARINRERLCKDARRAQGCGPLRGVVNGCTFKLAEHPTRNANIEYLIISTDLDIAEIGQETQRADHPHQQFKVHVDFEVVPLQGETYRPEPLTPRPILHTATALVVGPENQPVWTDELGRIKIQFPWDRSDQHDQNASCWVRTNQPWSGNQLGTAFIPRIGSEVIVSFISGDPDLPIVTGAVNNQHNQPAWQLPSQQALSGIRSREHSDTGGNSAAGRSNHLVMDDTKDKMQVQLHSAHQDSQVNLGYVRHIHGHAGCQKNRGQGVELFTKGRFVQRSHQGMLVTTDSLPDPKAPMTEMGAASQRLTQARDQHETLAELAQQHQAQEHNADQSAVAQAIKAQNDAIQGSGGNPAAGNFPELAEPHLVLASPVGIESTTEQSTHLASGKHTAITSGAHLSLSVGQRLLASVKNGIRLFTYHAGMKLIAAAGDIDIKALKDGINIIAKLKITETADIIDIAGKKSVRLSGGGSYTEWSETGIESGTNGDWLTHCASHDFTEPANMPLPTLPAPVQGKEQMVFQLHTLAGTQHATPEPYELYRDGALIDRGVLDAWGRVVVKNHIPTSKYEVKLSDGGCLTLPVSQQLSDTGQNLANKGVRQLGNKTDGRSSQLHKKSRS